MSYLVLARKYRPQTFADLVGQDQVSRTLQNALLTGRVAHAYLFSGPRGVGKTTAARLLAMALSCQTDDVKLRPCGQCENCLEIQSGQAVDVIEVDGASNRGINEIRDLRETVKYLPAKGRYKVYIIDEVHALTKDAFNALLKTLEEPPSHVVFIFATTETHKVLPTILSRCQRYDFRRIRVEDIVLRLADVAKMENITAENEALELIARQAEGGLRDSLSLMDQAIAAGAGILTAEDVRRSLGLIDQAIVRNVLNATLKGEAAAAISALDEAYARGYDFKDLGVKILEYIRGLTLLKLNSTAAGLMNLTETEEADFRKQMEMHSLETLHRHFDEWLKFQNDLNRNPQPRWLLEAQVIRMAQLAPLVPMTELMERMAKLLAENPPSSRPGTEDRSSSFKRESLTKPADSKSFAADKKKINSESSISPGNIIKEIEPVPSKQNNITKTSLDQFQASSGIADNSREAPKDWLSFARQYSEELDGHSRSMVAGATVLAFGPDLVSLRLPREVGLGNITRKHLESHLGPLLNKAFGQSVKLEVSKQEDLADNHALIKEKLNSFKMTPEAKTLMDILPGEFIDFKPAPKEDVLETDEDDVVDSEEEVSDVLEEENDS